MEKDHQKTGEGNLNTLSPASRKILPLSSHLIDQIAAGEVVERPSSIVKELVENSCDADATQVDIFLSQGGTQQIKVVDNGHGMEPIDIVVCMDRHTTSKLSDVNHLENLLTYGFRGEALSSISSVSCLTIRSRVSHLQSGFEIQSKFGQKLNEIIPVGIPIGTSVTVEELFSHLPARKKFLRTSSTELSHCIRVIKEIALSKPDIEFVVFHGGAKLLHWVRGTREERFLQCFSWDYLPYHFLEEEEGKKVEAFLSPPIVRREKTELLICVNHRMVRNRMLASAVRQAYLDVCGPHHEPSGVIFLDLSEGVDCNVHPQKLEVRLEKSQAIYGWLLAVTRKKIAACQTIKHISLPNNSRDGNREQDRGLFNSSGFESPAMKTSYFGNDLGRDSSITPSIVFPNLDLPSHEGDGKKVVNQNISSPVQIKLSLPALRFIGQYQSSFLVCEDSEGLVLVDQHALHERICYESLCREDLRREVLAQQLLVPKTIKMTVQMKCLFTMAESLLQGFGFEVDLFSDQVMLVRSYPSQMKEEKVEGFILDCFTQWQEEKNMTLEKIKHKTLSTLACHLAISANMSLAHEVAEKLLSDFEMLSNKLTCPHGRPILFRFLLTEIQKHFHRI